MDEFFLSSEQHESIRPEAGSQPLHWKVVGPSGVARPALILNHGDSATFGPVSVSPDTQISVRYGSVSNGPSRLSIQLVAADGGIHALGTLGLASDHPWNIPRQASFDLAPWAGQPCEIKVLCDSRTDSNAHGDEGAAIYDLAIGSEYRKGILRARAFRKERSINEAAHFAGVYDHTMYRVHGNDGGGHGSEFNIIRLEDIAPSTGGADAVSAEDAHAWPEPLPNGPSNAFDYAHHLLGRALRAPPPNFGQHLLDMRERCEASLEKPLKILSLCAGAARIEAQFSELVGPLASWTLVDINAGLLESAASNFGSGIRPTLILADVNDIKDFGERFDIVMCVSGLHHIVELERVLRVASQILTDSGELWCIGEAIGRSGNRLFGEDYDVANSLFQALPKRYRRNRNTGMLDEALPNADCSDATFEGIRSDEIEPIISTYFEPVDVYRRNCFLWRMVDLAYSDNYDLSDPQDVRQIQALVDAELAHFRAGGHPTELHGIYRRRLL